MKFLIAFVLACVSTVSTAQVQGTNQLYLNALANKERTGIKYYQREEFDRAFELLNEAAQGGFKQSQYLLGLMYLKGEHVEQSLGTGLAWLGVANEMDMKGWQQQYDDIYARLNEAQQAFIDGQVAEYIEKYGMDALEISCEKRARLGSRKIEIECLHRDRNPGVTTSY